MRKLRRPPVNLPALTGTGSGARLAAKHAEDWESRARVPLAFPDHWKRAEIRGALLAFHGRVCAYCQCGLPRNDPGAVEHFRPKSIYWWLAYDFSNYFLSCSVCNSQCKLEKFPLQPGSGPLPYTNRDRLREEKRLLLDPAADEVEAWMSTDHRDDTCRIVPHKELAADSEAYLQVLTTIELFKLNEDPRLTDERIEIIGRALKNLEALEISSDPVKADEIRRMASRFQPHGISIRQMLAAQQNSLELIPSPVEELLMFLQDLLRELSRANKALREFPKSKPARLLQRQIRWALAILWKFPPAGPPDLVEDFLKSHGCRDEVARYYRRL